MIVRDGYNIKEVKDWWIEKLYSKIFNKIGFRVDLLRHKCDKFGQYFLL